MRMAVLTLKGIHCEGCATKLESRLREVRGVHQVAVSFAKGEAEILYDPNAIGEEYLVGAIKRSGFHVVRRKVVSLGNATVSAGGSPVVIGGVGKRPWKPTLLAVPAILASLIPSMHCPLCLTAYTALLSTFGLGVLMSSTYLLPLTVAMLAVAVAALGFEAAKRGSWSPFALSLLGSAVIVAGKFLFASQAATYSGVALLLAASIWNLAPGLRSFAGRPDTEMSS